MALLIVDLWQYHACCITQVYAGEVNRIHDFETGVEIPVPLPDVPARITRDALAEQRYTYAPPRCSTLQNRRTFILLSVSP